MGKQEQTQAKHTFYVGYRIISPRFRVSAWSHNFEVAICDLKRRKGLHRAHTEGSARFAAGVPFGLGPDC